MLRCLLVGVLVLLSTVSAFAQERKDSNSNGLIKDYAGNLQFTCSTYWPTWGPEKAFDGNPLKSWFTASGDAAAFGKNPWIAVEFPHDVEVRRVTLLSNREPPWQVGYTILVGRLELLDQDGKVLFFREDELGGERADMEVRPKEPVRHVRKIRFASLKDEGDKKERDANPQRLQIA